MCEPTDLVWALKEMVRDFWHTCKEMWRHPFSRSVCPKCRKPFKLETWQVDDGPCTNGDWYCVDCILKNQCGCAHAK